MHGRLCLTILRPFWLLNPISYQSLTFERPCHVSTWVHLELINTTPSIWIVMFEYLTAFCLPDVTWHHCTWWDLPHLLPLCSVAVFKVCIQVQAGKFYHMRDFNVFLGRGGVWRILVPSWWGKSPRPPSKWSCTRWWKIKANGMHSFLFQMKLCPQKCLIFADMNLCKFLLSHQIAVLSVGLLETHMNN